MTSTMRFDKWENSLGQPYGTVLQAVQYLAPGKVDSSKTTLLVTTSTSFSTLMTRSIVTKQANSAILVLTNTASYSGGEIQRGKARLTRNGTVIDADQYALYTPVYTFQQHSFKSLDFPNVAAGTTLVYNFDVACSQNGVTLNVGYGDISGGPGSSIVLLEIAQ